MLYKFNVKHENAKKKKLQLQFDCNFENLMCFRRGLNFEVIYYIKLSTYSHSIKMIVTFALKDVELSNETL